MRWQPSHIHTVFFCVSVAVMPLLSPSMKACSLQCNNISGVGRIYPKKTLSFQHCPFTTYIGLSSIVLTFHSTI